MRTLEETAMRKSKIVLYCLFIAASLWLGIRPALGQVSKELKENRSVMEGLSAIPAVVQNRFFRKALRPEISLSGGRVLNEAYSSTYSGNVRLGLYFSEYVGAEIGFTQFSSSNSADLDALYNLTYFKKEPNNTYSGTRIVPSFVRLKSATTTLASFAPVYGKINVFDKVIIYSDIVVSGGIAYLQTTGGDEIPVVIGVGQRFFFSKSFSLRVDALDYIFSEMRENKGQPVESLRHAWVVSLGLGVFLWGEES
jgi:outer membrane beta-barrel protein